MDHETEAALRMECLQIAADFASDAETALSIAAEFETFVFGYAPAEEPDDPGGSPCDCVSAVELDTTEPDVDPNSPWATRPTATGNPPPNLGAWRL